MPHLLAIENPHPVFALLALRRTLWQLAILGVASAVMIDALTDAPGMLPAWLILLPSSALFAHHRDVLFTLWRAAANRQRGAIQQHRRPLRRQASRRSESLPRRRLPQPVREVRQAR